MNTLRFKGKATNFGLRGKPLWLILLITNWTLTQAIDCDPGYYYVVTDEDTETGLC